ncbi:UNVERIFIED_CONTAM: hypothetical protein HDU68_002913 [Siphonaria sp. JEL0065]|nr:hypothetical protein HDU68_002913 [Siphonaria sp. JEL0065]
MDEVHTQRPRPINYFESVHPDEGIPRDLLLPLLEHEYTYQQETYEYDPIRGNTLNLYKRDNVDDVEYLLTAGGLGANELYVYSINETKVVAQQSRSYSFKTPIQQITSSRKQGHINTSKLVGVRTFSSVSILSSASHTQHSQESLEFHEIHCSRTVSDALDLVFNPVLPYEAAWICADRSIHIWDLLAAPETPGRRMRVIGSGDWSESETSTSSKRNNSLKWKGIDHAWHPRILLIGEAKQVSVLDLRSPDESLLPFYTPPSSLNLLRGITTNPFNAFEVGLCGTESTTLVDTRYPKHPLLEWKVNDPEDGPVGIQFLKTESESALVTWNHRHGDIALFPYSTPDLEKTTPIHSFLSTATTSKQRMIQSKFKPQRLPPFHHHDALYSSPFKDRTFSIPTTRIDLFHPEEPSWNVMPDAIHPLFKKHKKRSGFASVAEDDDEGFGIGVGEKKNGKEETRRDWEGSVPSWPGLSGVVMRDCGGGGGGGVDLFQASVEGTVYLQRFLVSGGMQEQDAMDQHVEEIAGQADWIAKVEKKALEEYQSLPLLRQEVVVRDVTSYIEYFSNMLLNPQALNDGEPLDEGKYETVLSELVEQHESKTLFQLYEAARKAIPIQYSKEGHPILLHPRAPTVLTRVETVKALIDSQVAESDGSQTKMDYFMDMDTQPMDVFHDADSTTPSNSIHLRKIPLHFMEMSASTSSTDSDYSLESVRTLLETEFSLADLYPMFPSGVMGSGVSNNEEGVLTGDAVKTELQRLSELSRKTALDWIARDVLLSGSVIDGIHCTKTTAPSHRPGYKQEYDSYTQQTQNLEPDENGEYEDIDGAVDPTVKILLEERDLELPETATIHNTLMLSEPFQLSKEAILLKDKWDHPEKWYEDEYDAKRRMNIQVSLQSWSKARPEGEGVGEGGVGGVEGPAADNARKRKSGRATLTQQDVMRALDEESRYGSQVRVVSSQKVGSTQSFPASQFASQSLGASQIASPRVRPIGASGLRGMSPAVAGIKREGRMLSQSQSLQHPSLQRASLGGASLGSRLSMGGFGASQSQSQGASSLSQQPKKKPRKSGF